MKIAVPIMIAVALIAGFAIYSYIAPTSKLEEEKQSPPTKINQEVKNEEEKPMSNIVETAIAAGKFNTLVAAVKAAALAETLSGPGPFTVFAPTDEAFAKLPTGTVESLLKDKAKLAGILTYHVVPGKVMAKDVINLTSAKTVQGGTLKIDTTNGVMVNDSKVITTDIETSNGVIHVIDSVLLP